jgi:hypothetical protein
MLEANPSLTPNAVKAILEYTAEARAGYTHLTQGAGFLNARGAVELARAFADAAVLPELSADPVRWSRQIIWGNRRVAGGMLGARTNAWKLGVTWGDARTAAGESIAWGASCRDDQSACNPAPWTTPCNLVTPDCDPSAPLYISVSDSGEDLAALGDLSSLIPWWNDPLRAGVRARPADALDGRRRPAGTAGPGA